MRKILKGKLNFKSQVQRKWRWLCKGEPQGTVTKTQVTETSTSQLKCFILIFCKQQPHDKNTQSFKPALVLERPETLWLKPGTL